jgi:hypothetical protein
MISLVNEKSLNTGKNKPFTPDQMCSGCGMSLALSSSGNHEVRGGLRSLPLVPLQIEDTKETVVMCRVGAWL